MLSLSYSIAADGCPPAGPVGLRWGRPAPDDLQRTIGVLDVVVSGTLEHIGEAVLARDIHSQ